MVRTALIFLGLSSLALGQFRSQVQYVTNLSTGACSNGMVQVKIADGTLNVCKNGTWGQPPGGAASAGGSSGQLQINSSGSLGGITAGGDVTFSTPNFTVTKINGTALSGLGTGILKNTTGTGVPSIAVAGDFPTLNQSTTGNAASATALAGSPTNCSAGQFPLGIAASGNAQNCTRLPQLWFGTAAPGSVAGNLPGDLFSDTTHNTMYFCNATSGTAAPACTSVTSGGWQAMVWTVSTLTSNMPLFGGGGPASIAIGTRSGNTTEVATTTGSQTSTAMVVIDANGNHNAGTATEDGSGNISTSGSVTSGASSSNTGYLQLSGGTSGSVIFTVPNVAGTQDAYVIPNPNSGSANQFLQLGSTTTCPTNVPGTCYSTAWASPAGSGTVSSASANQVAVYSAATTVGGSANLTYSAGNLEVGAAASQQGALILGGSGSGTTTLAAQTSGGGTMTLQAGTDTIVGRATTDTLTNKTINCNNNTCTLTAAIVPAVLTTVGSSRSLANAAEIVICTTTCTVTPPATGSTVAGDQFCVQNDDNVNTVITIAAVTSVQYENTARTSYKTANTSLASSGAIKDQICMVARDATHWNVFSATGTWN